MTTKYLSQQNTMSCQLSLSILVLIISAWSPSISAQAVSLGL